MLVLTTLFIYIVHSARLLDAVKVSLTILFSVSGFIKVILGAIAPSHIQDNWCVIICILLSIFELILLTIYHKVSNR